jgi:hypothetical protein
MNHLFKSLILLLSLSVFSKCADAQNMFTGKWDMDFIASDNSTIKITLEIGNPEQNLLFPARLSFQSNEFNAKYQLLLVKKSSKTLAISKNKYPLSETPFSLGTWMIMLNGVFEFSKDDNGKHQLSIKRIVAKKYGEELQNVDTYPASQKNTASKFFTLLKDAEINLKKNSPVNSLEDSFFNITQPKLSRTYFGIMDTIEANAKGGTIKFDNNSDKDIISLTHNENMIFDQIDSRKKREPKEIILDTGLNIIVLFADDFGNTPPSTASIQAEFGENKRSIDFKQKENIGASFIVLKVLNRFEGEYSTEFQQIPTTSLNDTLNNPGYVKVKDKDSRLKNRTTTIDRIISKSDQITFALWDDAIEDGDSISININGKWITRGFPVKKKPQYIYVTLDKGVNNIVFIADNLGSIIPNTTVLEIIDGKKRKIYSIETDMDDNNQVKIFYNYDW